MSDPKIPIPEDEQEYWLIHGASMRFGTPPGKRFAPPSGKEASKKPGDPK